MTAVMAALMSCRGGTDSVVYRDCGISDVWAETVDMSGHECVWESYSTQKAVLWVVRAYTLEGDPVPITLSYEPASGVLVTKDATADRFGGVGNQRIFTYRCQAMTKATHPQDISRYGFRLTNCSGDGSSTSLP